MKIGILLSGNGVFDGAEIQESIFAMLAIAENGGTYQIIAPNENQFHVINHSNGEEMSESRNMMVEAARIARGDIKDLATVSSSDFDAIVLPGGFGTAKNFTDWAFKGPNSTINTQVQRIIREMYDANKPIVGLCMAPVVIAKALEGYSKSKINLTVGSDKEASPYNIQEIASALESIGYQNEYCNLKEISYNQEHKIITAPCYMLEANIVQIRENAKQAIDKLFEVLKS